jgi:hypothetical protein
MVSVPELWRGRSPQAGYSRAAARAWGSRAVTSRGWRPTCAAVASRGRASRRRRHTGERGRLAFRISASSRATQRCRRKARCRPARACGHRLVGSSASDLAPPRRGRGDSRGTVGCTQCRLVTAAPAGAVTLDAANGNTSVKHEPAPGVLSTLTVPRMRWARLRLIDKPSPVPPCRRV